MNEIWVLNLNIDTKKYDTGFDSLKSIRPKKLLLKKKEITKVFLKLKIMAIPLYH